MGNKYQEEARLLVEDLEGTKWSDAVAPRSESRPDTVANRVADYVREKPLVTLVMVAGFAFAYGALRSIRTRF